MPCRTVQYTIMHLCCQMRLKTEQALEVQCDPCDWHMMDPAPIWRSALRAVFPSTRRNCHDNIRPLVKTPRSHGHVRNSEVCGCLCASYGLGVEPGCPAVWCPSCLPRNWQGTACKSPSILAPVDPGLDGVVRRLDVRLEDLELPFHVFQFLQEPALAIHQLVEQQTVRAGTPGCW